MSSATQHPNGYSVRDVILRYESEEEEFVRELEQMMSTNGATESTDQEIEEQIDNGPPILSVLCQLFDEIGSLKTENRRLKNRLIPQTTRTKNVVQRMSAMFEQRGSGLFPKLRRANRSSDSVEIRNGARERLSTPPRKELNSMTTSTDVSFGDRNGVPPIVQPEMSDSEIDEQIFNMDDDEDDDDNEHRSRDTTRRCDSTGLTRHTNDHSTSACTSPSSASSSRDPSENMTTSRSSFLDIFGFRRRSSLIPQLYTKTTSTTSKQVVKKRRKKLSGNDSESSGMYANLDDDHCSRLANKPPRPASYYRRDDSEDSADCMRQQCRQRKATSFLNVSTSNGYDNCHEKFHQVDRLTQMQHEKDNLMAEIEELKMRNQRLVEQLREKSQQQSKLQCQLHKAEMQVNTLSRKCTLSEALDRLTFDERMEKSATNCLRKIEERLKIFENQMQNAKLEAANIHQITLNSTCNERLSHQNCLEKLENLQREHMRVIHSNLLEIGVDELNMKRRLENLPTYEALYTFTHSVVRRLNEARWAVIEKTNEASRAQMDLIATQSSLLVTHAQMERLRIIVSNKSKRQKRPASFHGHNAADRAVRHELNFYLPFKLQGSRVENARRKRCGLAANERNIEEEFLKLFAYSKEFSHELEVNEKRVKEVNRIENMMREMNGNEKRRRPGMMTRERSRGNGEPANRRPISLVETEERRVRRNEETRRSIKFMKTNSIDHPRLDEIPQQSRNTVKSSQDIPSGLQSPHNTPVFSRRVIIPQKGNVNYDMVPDAVPQMGRIRKLERAFSTESRNTVESLHDTRDEWKYGNNGGNGGGTETTHVIERRISKIQRSQPVSRMKQPSSHLTRYRTIEHSGPSAPPQPPNPISLRTRTMEPSTHTIPEHSRIPTPSSRLGEKRSWLDRLKGITKT